MNKSVRKLLAGYKQFREKYFKQDDSVYQKLATAGQAPKTLLIGCSDSRVDPAILTNAQPGELFVVRNVANLVPPCEPSAVGFHGTSSAIEFAVEGLKVENIIILGHRQCGGVRALLRGPGDNPDSFINHWMSIAEEARQVVFKKYPKEDEETQWRIAEMETLKVSIKNVKTFPFVTKAIKERNLNVMAIYFDLEQGLLWQLDETSQTFKPLKV